MTIDSNIGQATKFQDSLDQNQMPEEDSSDSESDKNEISNVSDNDYENLKKVDIWAKKTKLSKKRKIKTNTGVYQRPLQTLKKIKLQHDEAIPVSVPAVPTVVENYNTDLDMFDELLFPSNKQSLFDPITDNELDAFLDDYAQPIPNSSSNVVTILTEQHTSSDKTTEKPIYKIQGVFTFCNFLMLI